jgi:dolichol-phosphate mannosyltransferase
MIIRLAVIVPVYNEETSVFFNISHIHSKVNELQNCSLIVVNDGSTDNTQNELQLLNGKLKKNFDYINLKINSGYGSANKVGYLFAKKKQFTHVLFMDSDLTNSPDDIPLFLNALKTYDYVKASRYESDGTMIGIPFFRKFHSIFAANIAKFLIGKKFTDPTNGFRAFKVGLLPFQNLKSNDFSIIMEELAFISIKKRIRIANLPVPLTNRADGAKKSAFSYNLKIYYRYLKPSFKVFLFRIGIL